jgi:hypothetical protein
MEHELDSQKAEFYEELTSLMKSAALVKIHGWSRAKSQVSIIDLIKAHNYSVESYTILNVAKLKPRSSGSVLQETAPSR